MFNDGLNSYRCVNPKLPPIALTIPHRSYFCYCNFVLFSNNCSCVAIEVQMCDTSRDMENRKKNFTRIYIIRSYSIITYGKLT